MSNARDERWFEYLTDSERASCEEELTDAYFAALNTDAWGEFRSAVGAWRARAEAKELLAV